MEKVSMTCYSSSSLSFSSSSSSSNIAGLSEYFSSSAAQHSAQNQFGLVLSGGRRMLKNATHHQHYQQTSAAVVPTTTKTQHEAPGSRVRHPFALINSFLFNILKTVVSEGLWEPRGTPHDQKDTHTRPHQSAVAEQLVPKVIQLDSQGKAVSQHDTFTKRADVDFVQIPWHQWLISQARADEVALAKSLFVSSSSVLKGGADDWPIVLF